MVAHLEYQNQVLKLQESTTIIGRMGDFFQIFDPSVSRRHFKICKENDVYSIYNISQKSHVLVNGQRVPETGIVLPDFATIECGKSTFTFFNLISVKMDSGEILLESDSEEISTGKICHATGPLVILMYSIATLLQERSWSEQLVKLETLKLIASYLDVPVLVIISKTAEPGEFKTIVTYRKPSIVQSTSQIIVQKNIIDECFQNRRAVTRNDIESVLCIPIETKPFESVLYMTRATSHVFKRDEVMVSGAIGKLIAFFHNHEKLKQQMERSQRLEMIGTVAAGIVHSFNNILGGIVGNVDLLSDELKNKSLDSCDEYLQNIQYALKDAISLTQDILSYTRDIQANATQLEINQLLFNIYKIYRPVLPGNIEFIIQPSATQLFTNGNPSQLTQAFLNLIQNAAQAMSDGGKIVIEVSTVEHKKTASKSTQQLQEGKYIKVVFKDSGIGMDTHTLKRIFTPLFTTKPAPHGTGLGLSYTLATVEKYHGSITVKSQLGVGTEFHVYLPLEEIPSMETVDIGSYLNGSNFL